MSAGLPRRVTVEFNLIQLNCLLRHARIQRAALWRDYLMLEEQVRTGHNGTHDATARVLHADIACLDEAIAKLWAATP